MSLCARSPIRFYRSRRAHQFFSARIISTGLDLPHSSAPTVYFTSRTFGSVLSRGPTAAASVSNKFVRPSRQRLLLNHRRFRTEADFHDAADSTLEDIQDAVEVLFEDNLGDDDDMPEVTVASGVLTLSMPPHGTWVINKQTPNRQIWWSSPLSGPRRYEYDDERDAWVFTRYVDAVAAGREIDDDEFRDSITLGTALATEIKELYDLNIDLAV